MNKITYFGSILNQSQIAEKQQKKTRLWRKLRRLLTKDHFPNVINASLINGWKTRKKTSRCILKTVRVEMVIKSQNLRHNIKKKTVNIWK